MLPKNGGFCRQIDLASRHVRLCRATFLPIRKDFYRAIDVNAFEYSAYITDQLTGHLGRPDLACSRTVAKSYSGILPTVVTIEIAVASRPQSRAKIIVKSTSPNIKSANNLRQVKTPAEESMSV
jgi:hypothetical protein